MERGVRVRRGCTSKVTYLLFRKQQVNGSNPFGGSTPSTALLTGKRLRVCAARSRQLGLRKATGKATLPSLPLFRA